MATRHQSRFASISLLYSKEMGAFSEEFLDEFLAEQKIRNEQKNFTISLFEGVLENQINIDNKLNSFLNKWKLHQIGAIERAILRLGAYELMFANTDAKVIISEAVALANEFSGESSAKLINAVLDKIAKNPKILNDDEVEKLNENLKADNEKSQNFKNPIAKNFKNSLGVNEAKKSKIPNKQKADKNQKSTKISSKKFSKTNKPFKNKEKITNIKSAPKRVKKEAK